jgi:hypothetical protein
MRPKTNPSIGNAVGCESNPSDRGQRLTGPHQSAVAIASFGAPLPNWIERSGGVNAQRVEYRKR